MRRALAWVGVAVLWTTTVQARSAVLQGPAGGLQGPAEGLQGQAEGLQGQAEGLQGQAEGASGSLAGPLEASVERVARAGRALRVAVRGGAPFERLALVLDGPAGPLTQLLLLDAEGRYERIVAGVELDAPLGVRFVRPATSARGGPELVASTRVPPRAAVSGHTAQLGAVVVSEIMKDPVMVSDAFGEWFELVNVSAAPIDLEGWTISDFGSNQHTIDVGGAGLVVFPGQRLVLGINDDPSLNGWIPVDYRYSGFTLGNGADEIVLRGVSGGLVDIVAYDNGSKWPDAPGVALNLTPSATSTAANDLPANWCDATSQVGVLNPDLGTPGLPNTVCP